MNESPSPSFNSHGEKHGDESRNSLRQIVAVDSHALY